MHHITLEGSTVPSRKTLSVVEVGQSERRVERGIVVSSKLHDVKEGVV